VRCWGRKSFNLYSVEEPGGSRSNVASQLFVKGVGRTSRKLSSMSGRCFF
jgi:hypothetical protein